MKKRLRISLLIVSITVTASFVAIGLIHRSNRYISLVGSSFDPMSISICACEGYLQLSVPRDRQSWITDIQVGIPFSSLIFTCPQTHNFRITGMTIKTPAASNIYAVKLWLAALLASAYPVAMLNNWVLRQLRGPDVAEYKCESCGYDLTGNQSGVCPECGEPLTVQT